MSAGSLFFLTLHARQMIGQSDEWRVFQFELKDCPLGKYYEVTGAITPLKKTGPGKGQPNWRKRDRSTEKTVQIAIADNEAFVAQWEAETGLCAECHGDGQKWIGWNAETGHRYNVCPRCNGTGRWDRQGQPQLAIDQLEMAL